MRELPFTPSSRANKKKYIINVIQAIFPLQKEFLGTELKIINILLKTKH